MSTTIDVAFTKQYESEVHTAYQRMGSKLRNTVRTKTATNSKDVTFPKYGRGMASTKARHGDVPIMNNTHTSVTATLADYYAAEYIDKLDELKTNIDERTEASNAGAYALGRKTDDLIITALSGASTSVTLGTATAAAFRNKVLEALSTINALDVPDNDRWGIVSPISWSWLMIVPEFKSADYMGYDQLPYAKGSFYEVKRWMGVNWMQHSALQAGASTVNYLYHRGAIGHAIGQEVTAMFDWVPQKVAHLVNHSMSQGSVLIDSEGVVKMALDETAALASS